MTLLLLLACTSSTPDDSALPTTDGGSADGGSADGGAGDGGAGDGGSTDGGAGDGGSPDGGGTTEPAGSGEALRQGEATVLDSFAGIEALLFIDEDGEGEELCRLELQLASVASRTDCDLCLWAWDLEIVAATTVLDEQCAAAGYDAAADWVGQTLSYGYTDDYFGHAPAMLAWLDGSWQAVSYAWWDSSSGQFLYQVSEGYFPYGPDGD